MTSIMPLPFSEGLDNWSSGNGTANTPDYTAQTYSGYVPADQDFGGCLEIYTESRSQQLRYMTQTAFGPETYLKVVTRVKLISGPKPSVRIAGFPRNRFGSQAVGEPQSAPQVFIPEYGTVYEISTIIGPSARADVGIVWSTAVETAHIGLDIIGATGTVLRVDDIEITNVANDLVDQKLARLDVRDYGAVGDGVTDNYNACVAASRAASGRTLYVPKGTFKIGCSLSIDAPIIFEGKLDMLSNSYLALTESFDLPSYISAFKDEEAGFEKALQALFATSSHAVLDMKGRRVTINRPIDVAGAVDGTTNFDKRRVVQNGQISIQGREAWLAQAQTSTASYSPSDGDMLRNVASVASIQVGSPVTGTGVGREVYVKEVDIAARTVRLSSGLYGVNGTQSFTFTRFQYVMDFSGFQRLNFFELKDVQFDLDGKANGVLLPKGGRLFQFHGCRFNAPKERVITSFANGCQGMTLTDCMFVSDESGTKASLRESIVLNANKNDVKIKNCWAQHFRHFLVLSGQNNLVTGNHFFQGDAIAVGSRTAGIVLAHANTMSTISNNYIDNCYVEWTNEHEAGGDYSGTYGFSALSMTGNVCLVSDVFDWFTFLTIKPYGKNHILSDLTVADNMFRAVGQRIDRIERVDTSFADLNHASTVNVHFMRNTFNAVSTETQNPLVIEHAQNSPSSTWRVSTSNRLPFGGRALRVLNFAPRGAMQDSSSRNVYHMPHVYDERGTGAKDVDLTFPVTTKGSMTVTISSDRR